MKRDESLSPSLFTFRSYFATVHRYYYYDFMTARGMRLPWAHRTRLQRLLLLLLTANVSNKSGNLLFAQSYPEQYENVGFVHSWCTVEFQQKSYIMDPWREVIDRANLAEGRLSPGGR